VTKRKLEIYRQYDYGRGVTSIARTLELPAEEVRKVLLDAGYTLLGADLTGKHPRNYRRNAKHSVRACAETSEDINRLLRAWVRVA
jgi:hypothetical protein